MKVDEAFKIYDCWRNEYIEIADKMIELFSIIPPSFWPYPIDTMIEALEIVSKHFYDTGNIKRSNNIIELGSFHFAGCKTDDEAISQIKKYIDLIESNTDLKNTTLKNLKDKQESWVNFRMNGNKI